MITSPEAFTPDERKTLEPFFTNLDSHVFALTNLPETVKGALFARYSRSAKSLRRLFLDEFAGNLAAVQADASTVGVERAERLYAKVFSDYGDDSVAQLGGAHIACEYVSNILTKILEWGRLMAYLEQSTRYVPYTDKLHGRWRYHVPEEVEGALRDRYVATMDAAFETYASLIDGMQKHFAARYPRAPQDSEGVHRAAIRAKALDTLRGMLPGGDAVERRHLRHRAGVRGAPAPHARASARGSQAVRRPDAGRAAEARAGVPDPRRSARARRALEPVPRVRPATRRRAWRRRSSRTSRRSRATR